jgi:hypothetical protein
MSIERTYYCDGPDCPAPLEGDTPRHVRTAAPPPHLPCGLLEVRESDVHRVDVIHHFCTWDCLMKYAAQKPPTEFISGESSA